MAGACVGSCFVYSSVIFGRGGELLAENTASGAPLRSYVYLNGLALALVDSAGNINYILADQIGQPQRMVDGSGALVWDRIPDVFGATVAQPVGMSAANPLRFPGQQYDATTGLHYNHFRDYDPSLGRYVQSDPIGLAGGINTYAYARGNPISLTDPNGRQVPQVVVGIVIVAAVVQFEYYAYSSHPPPLPPRPPRPSPTPRTGVCTVENPSGSPGPFFQNGSPAPPPAPESVVPEPPELETFPVE